DFSAFGGAALSELAPDHSLLGDAAPGFPEDFLAGVRCQAGPWNLDGAFRSPADAGGNFGTPRRAVEFAVGFQVLFNLRRGALGESTAQGKFRRGVAAVTVLSDRQYAVPQDTRGASLLIHGVTIRSVPWRRGR